MNKTILVHFKGCVLRFNEMHRLKRERKLDSEIWCKLNFDSFDFYLLQYLIANWVKQSLRLIVR